VTDKLVQAIESDTFDFIVVNFANTDMVGHTGDLGAAVKAVEAVERCLGRWRGALEAEGGAMLITADHGNAETMTDPVTGEPHTAHTLNRVPVIVVGAGSRKLADGKLADVAPTLLDLMELPKPAVMTGHSLLTPREDARARVSA
jgi:2,3-bisphosphoglycerate-independent phosphoglycerate mutase